MLLFRYIALLFLLIPIGLHADFSIDLHNNWKFRVANEGVNWMPATVPGTAHTDLFANKVIPDPLLSTNEAKVQWVEGASWEYTSTFELDKKMLREKHIELQFEGLDTYADVYLNDSLLFTAENMFLSYTKDVKKLLKKKNAIRILFHPASELIEKNRKLSKIKKYPGGDRVFIRKAQYQFGWDWGPRLVTCGIWKPVHLIGWSDFRVDGVQYTLDKIENDTAHVVCEYHMVVDKPGKFTYTVSDGQNEYSRSTAVSKTGDFGCFFIFKVPNPRLWWCNGLGKQELYEFTFTIAKKKKKVVNKTITGLRRIELSSQLPGDPTSFYFIINGVPVYSQGCNWIPSDNFLPRIQNAKISNQLTDMRDLNMTMVRVWGGGIYESDYFYSKCDSLGLMVWQDLPFACGMYPLSVLNMGEMLNMEISDNFGRIYSHPSLAVICGDNENKEGWFNWGWQKELGYSANDSAFIYNEYQKFLYDIRHSFAYVPFIQSSPQNGWGRKIAYDEGDVHYWGVWWGMQPFSAYETHTGRFVSEFGFQGLPSFHTYLDIGYVRPGLDSYYMWSRDTLVRSHQKHPTGFETINTYMERDYGLSPQTLAFEDYIYVTQVMQRDAMTAAIESQRRNMPRCMGSLFWQYNDCWPVASWSVQDYYGRKKLAWYSLKKLYAPVMISIQETRDSIFVWIVNESSKEIHSKLIVKWNSFLNMTAYADTVRADVGISKSVIAAGYSKKTFFDTIQPGNGFAQAILLAGDIYKTPIVTTSRTFGKAIDQNYASGKITYGFVRYITEGPCTVSLSSKVYQQKIMLTCDDPNAEFSDNGFDLLPGETRTIEITTSNAALVEKSFRIKTMNDLVANARKKPEY